MKKATIMFLSVFLMFSCNQTAKEDNKESEVNTQDTQSIQDEKAYAIGYDIGLNIEKTGVPLDVATMSKGIADGFKGESAMEEDARQKALMDFKTAATEAMQTQQAAAAAENIGAAKTFLDENGKKEGVKTTASGLQYEVITMGEGDKPAETSKVKVHYAGTLVDGTEFDSSYKRNSPAEFPLNGVIKGWTEGLQLMPVGSKFRFFISPELGYGERGAGQIPPNAALIFEVELLDILSK